MTRRCCPSVAEDEQLVTSIASAFLHESYEFLTILFAMILENINYFHEVFNPLYAFPVVGVVLCALLVFAFGFKTPAQPPSFDFVEHRKVTAKKKTKSKEIKSVKAVQNGSAHASEPTSSVPALPVKAQNNKVLKTNNVPPPRKNTQTETKNKTKKTVSSIPNEKVEATDEANDNTGSGEWTQQLSRKDRKNRKGKDVSVNLRNTINLLTVSSKDNNAGELTKEIQDSSQESTEDKENVNAKEVQTSVEEIPLLKKDLSNEDDSSKKAKKKKKDFSEIENKLDSKEEPPAIISTKEMSKKGFKVLKEGENEIKERNSMDLSREMQLEKPEAKALEKEDTKDTSSAKTPEKEETPVETPSETTVDSAKPTSNVVFDELGDMWQDAKPQKKKKKVRRE